ncbi:MAG: lamin tail domain-containing protein [Deltaproteobacteria bacterium]|nr:lamin tail domain-containing protein [Deltaproteobacteria bacterium]
MKLPRSLRLWSSLALALFGCGPLLPSDPTLTDEPWPSEPAPGLPLLVTEPPAPLDAIPPVVRFHIDVAGRDAVEPSAFRLFEGELSEGQLEHAAEADLPETLAPRLVPALVFRRDDAVVLAPTTALRAATTYTLLESARRVARVTVAATDAHAGLALVWPKEGRSPSGLLAVYCGDARMEHVSLPISLDPTGVPGLLRSGVAPGEPSRRCVHFEPAVASSDAGSPLLPPPSIVPPGGDAPVSLEPHPLVRADEALDGSSLVACGDGEVPFGAGCVRVEDDRLLLRPPGRALLWSVQAAPALDVDAVFTTAGKPHQLWPLPPDSVIWLAVTTVDAAGGVRSTPALLRTAPPRAHFVIDEVLANPVGPEPRQEWIELVNDGMVAGSLAGLRLVDIGGEVLLPDVVLPPGGRALLVGDDYDASGKYDPAPLPGTPLVRVPRVGKDGLGNSGEPLELLAADGAPLSSFPAMKTKAGRSVFRRTPKSLDDFAMSEPGASTPGVSNDAMVASAFD